MTTTAPLRRAFAATIVLVAASFAGCDSTPPASNGNSTATNAPVAGANANTTVATPPLGPGDAKPPVGMEDTIEGRVVGLYCYKQNPAATPEALKACTLEYVAKGGQLGVLTANKVLYVDAHPDARITNAKLKDFVGEDVTVQGALIGDVPELNFADVTVKKFDMKLARRKGSAAVGAKPNMPAPKQSDVQRPQP